MRQSATVYRYRAARGDGALELGVVEASTRESAAALLSGRGLFPLELMLERETRTARSAVSPADLALGLRTLATLIESGLSMSRVLHAFAELAPPAWRPGLPGLRDRVREGSTLAHALERSPLELPMVIIGIVRAGEAGSGLARSVRRAAELAEEAATTRAALRAALAYPIVLACAASASIALLVGLVLPRFASILADLGQGMPTSTHLVLDGASTLRQLALPGAAVIVAGLLAWRAWISTEDGRREWHHLLLRCPVIGSVRLAAATSRAAGALSALLESGVPISPALLHASHATGDAAVSRRLLAARESVLHGARLAVAIEVAGAMTQSAVRLIRAGEETGRVAEMLVYAARIESERARETVRGTVRLIEPLLILGFGAIVALVTAALLQAVYSVRPA